MTKRLTVAILFIFCAFSIFAQTQSMEELKAKQAELKEQIAEKSGEVSKLQGELDGIEKEISILSGWQMGLTGLIGFDFNKSNDWISSPNPNSKSTALNIGLTAFANQEGRKHFWRNKAVLTKAWSDVDLSEADDSLSNDGLFDNGTVDILNISSLAGYKINDWFALSGLGEINTSLGNFLDPGTFDIGIGVTLTPIQNLVIVLHPLNYHVAFSGVDGVSSQGDLGAKFRVDYTNAFNVSTKKLSWSSTLTGFIPYGGKKQIVEGDPNSEVSLFEYTWLNTLSFEVWKGIGVGFSLGLRSADFEFDGTQNFYSIGLSYSVN